MLLLQVLKTVVEYLDPPLLIILQKISKSFKNTLITIIMEKEVTINQLAMWAIQNKSEKIVEWAVAEGLYVTWPFCVALYGNHYIQFKIQSNLNK